MLEAAVESIKTDEAACRRSRFICYLEILFKHLQSINRKNVFYIGLHFCLVPPIVFSFRANAFYYLGPYAAFHGMARGVTFNRRMNTSADVSNFKILPFHV
jgi:hypothetical protein